MTFALVFAIMLAGTLYSAHRGWDGLMILGVLAMIGHFLFD